METLVGKTTQELEAVVQALGAPAFRGRQIAQAIYKRQVRTWDGLTDLPRDLRARLAEHYDLAPCRVRSSSAAPDGTVKYLMDQPDGEVIESVFLPYPGRTSVCISSQVGCPMACSFCATGTEGLARNLSAGEIVDQVLLMQSLHPEQRITHVVFMGMGEPLLNYAAALAAIRILNQEVGIAMRHVTLSTVGVVPNIEKLADEDLQLTLAVSLHAPNDTLRSELVPLNEKYPIARLLQACRDYTDKTRRRITFEYVLLADVNDGEKEAHELGDLLRGMLAGVNVIPYNTTDVAAPYQRPTPEAQRRFREIVAGHGVTITQRKERGHRIAAACGQLKRSALRRGSMMRSLPVIAAAPSGKP
uniref:Probable dual-specificity RNA methyltransferase RlmN n=1 Tax=uncultured Armatimonadetes bacterium TaxID=157466 RepID=A0A6J4H2I8_9BACT|nr:23S rRNA (adenine(2503)-C(2))-methyltransferase @ tRNA (adenine(37)-C(2))-methyltransferase [uncultured Armatimonadetes bacterium]